MPVVWFIRHGESESNANLRTTHPAQSALTPVGRDEAELVVPQIETPPDLIVVSSYLRARQTAVPLIEKFPDTPMETWPVHEFTYLHPLEYKETTGAERWGVAKVYWEENEPQVKHRGEGESFAELMARVEALKMRLAQHPAQFIVVFSHGLFLRALLHVNIVGHSEPTPEMMERYRHFIWSVHMPNCAILKTTVAENGRFTFSGYDTTHLTP
ncbi:MAG: histidine phosphatase family protein [Chloroflexi bacterium]|nr:MAG: histidine phosphatase family protein [Chloroflexota bacterium]